MSARREAWKGKWQSLGNRVLRVKLQLCSVFTMYYDSSWIRGGGLRLGGRVREAGPGPGSESRIAPEARAFPARSAEPHHLLTRTRHRLKALREPPFLATLSRPGI